MRGSPKEEKKIVFVIIINFARGIRTRGGRRRWRKKLLNVNIINFAKVDKWEGGKTLIHQKWIICRFFCGTLPLLRKNVPFEKFLKWYLGSKGMSYLADWSAFIN